MKRRAISITRFTRTLAWVLDVIAIGALAGIPELNWIVFVVALSLLFVRAFTRFKLKDGVLTIALALISSTTFFAHYSAHVPIVLAMAHGAPIFHALLWFAAAGTRDLWLRLSVGFVELVLTSALIAEFYVPIVIFAFAILSGLMISANLLNDSGSRNEAELPHRFLPMALSRSAALLALSLMIFPMIPRPSGGAGLNLGSSKVGYTEDVSVTGQKILNGAGTGEVMMRLYFADGDVDPGKLLTIVPFGLLRGRTLERFDGVHWAPLYRGRTADRKPGLPEAHPEGMRSMEAIREPMTEVLPVPYGARNVWISTGASFTLPRRLTNGEWFDVGSGASRVRYRFTLPSDSLSSLGSDESNEPVPEDLRVPLSLQTRRMKVLTEHIFGKGPAADARKAVQRLSQFFHREGFHAASPSEAEELISEEYAERKLKMTSLEGFIFASKRGHCELFATASAMLLRLAGVPTRLVSGFRLSRGPVDGVLTVRTGDAHAWIEYYVPELGWKEFDPTPRTMMNNGMFNFIRDYYESLSTYWYRYIFTYDGSRGGLGALLAGKAKPIERFSDWMRSWDAWVTRYRGALGAVGALLVLLGLVAFWVIQTWFPWIFSIRERVREGPGWLKTERIRMERALLKTLARRPRPGTHRRLELESMIAELRAAGFEQEAIHLANWLEAYRVARFGPSSSDRARHVGMLAQRRREFEKAA